MRKAWIVGLLAAGGCQIVSEEEKSARLRAFAECLTREIVRLDDAKSDAATVGRAAAGACQAFSDRAIEAHTAFMLPSDAAALRRELRPENERLAVRMVLERRAGASGGAR